MRAMYKFSTSNVRKQKKSKKSIIKVCSSILASLVLVVAGVCMLPFNKNKVNVYLKNDINDEVVNVTVKNGVLTEQDLTAEEVANRTFAGWFYDSNFVHKAKVGDAVENGTILYGKYLNATETVYWGKVDNQLNAEPNLVAGDTQTTDPLTKNGSVYQITNEVDFGVFASLVNDDSADAKWLTASYKLSANLNLDKIRWSAVGTSTRKFQGTFDGDNHMVYYILGTKGVFNYVENATIQNLVVKGLAVNSAEQVGGLASFVTGNSTIKNCVLYGDVSSTAENIGGLIGSAIGTSANRVTLVGCSMVVRINEDLDPTGANVGGLIGESNYVDVTGCSSNGVIVSQNNVVGGLIGKATNTTVYLSVNGAKIKAKGNNVGGLVGVLAENSAITNSYNKGALESEGSNIGGLVGNSNGEVTNSYNLGNIDKTNTKNTDYVGGLVGKGETGSTVKNSYAFGNVTTDSSTINYNPISNNGTTTDSGYNITTKQGDNYVTKVNSPEGDETYATGGTKNMFNKDNENSTQKNLIDSLNESGTYNNYDEEGKKEGTIIWNIEIIWNTNIITYPSEKDTSNSEKDYENQTAVHHVNYYINGKLNSVACLKEGEAITAPSITNGIIEKWYTDADMTTEYDFTNKTMGSSDVNIYAELIVETSYNVSVSGSVSISNAVAKNTEAYETIITPKDSTTYFVVKSGISITMGGVVLSADEFTFDSTTNKLVITKVTGNIVIKVNLAKNVYNVVYSLTNINTPTENTVNYNQSFSTTLVPSEGYSLPKTIVVKMGEDTLSSNQYTYGSTTGSLTVPNVVGDLTIIAVGQDAISSTITFTEGGDDGGRFTINSTNYYGGNTLGVTSADEIVVSVSYSGYSSTASLKYKLASQSSYTTVAATVSDKITISNVTGDPVTSFTITNLTEDVTLLVESSCLVEGTYVTLANGKKKKIEDVTYEDELLVWDFDKGCFTKARPFWIKKQEKAGAVIRCEFSDGSVIEVINGHAIYSVQENKFLNAFDDKIIPGYTQTFNEKGELVTLVKKEIINKDVTYYNFHTTHHMNSFSNGIMTSVAWNNLYPIKNMKFVKDDREITPYEEFEKEGISRRYYDGLRLGEQPKELKENLIKDIKENYMSREVEPK